MGTTFAPANPNPYPIEVGAVQETAAIALPSNGKWLWCDGTQYNIAAQPLLFDAIGNAYGGDGVTNFNVPDKRGRGSIGAGQGPGLTNRPIGSQVGVETVTLTGAQVANHGHNVTDNGHVHTASQAVHTHAATQAAHGHGITDAGHVHTVTDAGHVHTVTDAGHVHAVTDAGHGHTLNHPNEGAIAFRFASTEGLMANPVTGDGVTFGIPNTDSALTGVAVNNGATGVAVDNHATGASVDNHATGVATQNSTPVITVPNATPAVTVDNQATGVTVQATAGGGGAHQNMQPSVAMNYIIKALPG